MLRHVTPALPTALFLSAIASFGSLRAQPSYHDHAALGRRLAAIAREHPARVAVRSLATTAGGRELWCATIGGPAADTRPAVLVVGGIDGARLGGSELALRLVALVAADASDSTRALLERTTFYVIPRASPDALESYFQRPRLERATTLTPFDVDRDGSADEDGPNDLDGNGLITRMRVRSPSGRWIADPLDERVMREADASRGERGAYELLVEGRDDDGDGEQNEDPAGGVDVNRNFTFEYKPFGPTAGAHAVSEIETRAIADFCFDHPNIVAVFAFSSQSNLTQPWEVRGEPAGRIIRTVRAEDQPTLARLGALYDDIVGAEGAPAYVKGEGSFVEWAYYHFGRVALGAHPWWMPLAKPGARRGKAGERAAASPDGAASPDAAPSPDGAAASDAGASPNTGASSEGATSHDAATSRDAAASPDAASAATTRPAMADTLAWLEANGVAGAHVPWRRIDHPEFKGREVEVGGTAPFVTIDPPAALLDSLAASRARFLLTLGGLLPRIELVDVRTESLGDGLTRVHATVVNTGYLPTLLAMGQTSRAPVDAKAELVLGRGQSVATGRRVQLLGPIAGSGGSKELTWVVAGRGELTLRVGGPMTGSLERTIPLGR
ncbi:MAG TPA: M14 family metallopeptidase [Candidatus Kapabacteria bacterium]|nr:M14 family metallopeptidase [Candidatus Kapabacteria bacterium]